jgi:hypothetical protein
LASYQCPQQAPAPTESDPWPLDMQALLADLQAYPKLLEYLARRISPEVMGQLLALLVDSGRRSAIGQLRAAGLISPDTVSRHLGPVPAEMFQVLRDLAWVACDQIQAQDPRVRLQAMGDIAAIARIIDEPFDETSCSRPHVARWIETFLGKK